MFFRRRGCLLGCSVLFALCVAVGLLGWYVVIPEFADQIKDDLGDNLATEISQEINPLYTRADLQDGQQVRFSFESINQSIANNNSDNPEDTIRITSSGNRVVMRAEIQGQEFEVAFVPRVSADGKLELEPVDDNGWWKSRFMDVLGGGFETGVNEWLEVNGLVLTDVAADGDGLLLTVEGQ